MAVQKIKWTPTAKKSLKEILNFYNIRNGNFDYSLKILESLKKAISLLPQNNLMGKEVEYSDLRVFVIERHHIFYKISEELMSTV